MDLANAKELKIKRQKRENSTKVLVIIGYILIAIIVTGFFSAIIKLDREKINLLNYEQEVNSIKSELEYEINDLQCEKQTLLKEINDLTYSKNELEKYYQELANSKVIDKWVPDGYGDIHSYMPYNQNWIKSSMQYKFHNDVSSYMYYDEYGYAKLDDRYFVAVKPYYGDIGDYLDVYQEDGSIIKCVVGDNKGFENDDLYIHHDGSIVEFMVKDNSFVGVNQTRPDFCQKITVIKNIGNYYDE